MVDDEAPNIRRTRRRRLASDAGGAIAAPAEPGAGQPQKTPRVSGASNARALGTADTVLGPKAVTPVPRPPSATPQAPTARRAPATLPVPADRGAVPNAAKSEQPVLQRRGKRRALSSYPDTDIPDIDIPDTDRDNASDESAPVAAQRPRPKRKLWKQILLGTLAALVLFTAAVVGGLVWFVERVSADLPSVQTLKAGYHPPQITRVFARDATLLASIFTERRTVIDFDQVLDAAKLAFLAAEDASFYEHQGLNYLGMVRALLANLRAGHTVQGGSTITQQVVKNVLLDQERSYRRKIRETVLARRLEASLSKDEIFWLYLNHIYLGHGRYGIEEAARYYFGKHARELGLDEAAVLAGLVASPERFSPRRDAHKALQRRRYELDQMHTKGFVTDELYAKVLTMPLHLAPAEESESKLAPEIVERAKRTLNEATQGRGSEGGYSVETTLDPELQAAARAAVRDNLDAYMTRHKLAPPYTATKVSLWGTAFVGKPSLNRIYVGTVEGLDDQAGTISLRVGEVAGRVLLSNEVRYNPKHLPPSSFTKVGALLRAVMVEEPAAETPAVFRLELGPQSALVAVDVRSREVLAMVGGYDAVTAGLDRATQARRQPGSTFKPIVYSYGLHARRYTAATPIAVEHAGHGVPEEGPKQLSFRNALAQSNNEAATAVLREVGPEAVVAWARELGIQSPLKPDLSMALGSYEVTPIELLSSYVAFANGGQAGQVRFVRKVTGPDGGEVQLPSVAENHAVMTAEEAYLVTSLLRSVVEVGTGRTALSLGREVAGKTGTTNGAKDTWFVGYSTDIAALVWVGYDDARSLGPRESGTVTALPAWVQFMKAAHKQRPKTRFVQPSSVLSIAVDPVTGLLPQPGQSDTLLEEFLPGTEPTTLAPAPLPSDTAAVDGPAADPKDEPAREPGNLDAPAEDPEADQNAEPSDPF